MDFGLWHTHRGEAHDAAVAQAGPPLARERGERDVGQHLGFGRIVVSDIAAPNMLVNLV
jgi:hypothetical protein